MTDRNRYWLSRTIPADIKREVRQRCCFGCVRCGLGFYEYEHFNPDFKDAAEHRAEGITLLCSQCNQKRARGVLSRETVIAANANPKCAEQGFSRDTFDYGSSPIEVVVAGTTFYNCKSLIEINGISILSINPPEESGQPYRLSGLFADNTGDITLIIRDNEWAAGADNWDVERIGQRITIRNGPRNIVLVLREEPPTRLVVEQLNMQFENVHLRGSDGLEISLDGKNWNRYHISKIGNCETGMSFNNR